jgi:inner membrane protein
MDQATQILLGGVAAQATFGRPLGRTACVVGAVAGFLPDADMALRGLADPLFPLEIHRTFSHSLVAVPLGAALVTLLFLPFPPFRQRKLAVFGAAFVGWLTHAPLDLCTSYGTMILWPFDHGWYALDIVSIIDPIFTFTLLVGLLLALRRRSPRPAWAALALALLYLGLGALQRERALEAQATLAAARGQKIEHARVIPVMGGLLLWRSLYVATGEIHADAFRLVPGLATEVAEGGKLPRFVAADLPEGVPDRAHVREVLDRYLAFADGLAARTPGEESVVGDMRYSLTPAFDPVWGLRLVSGEAALWVERAHVDRDLGRFLETILGQNASWHPLEERTSVEVPGP